MSESARDLYTRRSGTYDSFVQAFGHRQGLAAMLACSGVLASSQRVLDAGCGTGLSTLALAEAFAQGGLSYEALQGFDLTPAMIDRCRTALGEAGIAGVELQLADVLRLDDQLPASWTGYDLIISVSMLEHVPRGQLVAALSQLAARLAPGGRLIVVTTRRWFYPVRWSWHCEGYTATQLRSGLRQVGLVQVATGRYPPRYGWLNVGNVVAHGTAPDRAQSV
jgi:2-polyprenyl-3-methyl-5-hydroxy-6-metoxy-1,4-benzoquinol methylase